MNRHTASPSRLLVFVKAPRPGTVKTRLAATLGARAAADAYSEMVDTLLNELRPLPNVCLHFAPEDAHQEISKWGRPGWESEPQCPGDLGPRIVDAFRSAFRTNVNKVVLIGSDCPYVTVQDIKDATNALEHSDVVLGPATDGGYWLIGLRQLTAELFRDIDWSTDQVLNQTVAKINTLGLTHHMLRPLTDIDTEEDWIRFQQFKRSER